MSQPPISNQTALLQELLQYFKYEEARWLGLAAAEELRLSGLADEYAGFGHEAGKWKVRIAAMLEEKRSERER